MQEIWDYEKIKLNLAKKHGYKVFIVWESEYKNNKKKYYK
jgi:hypothetical protein